MKFLNSEVSELLRIQNNVNDEGEACAMHA